VRAARRHRPGREAQQIPVSCSMKGNPTMICRTPRTLRRPVIFIDPTYPIHDFPTNAN
jgi:hypothetical protein